MHANRTAHGRGTNGPECHSCQDRECGAIHLPSQPDPGPSRGAARYEHLQPVRPAVRPAPQSRSSTPLVPAAAEVTAAKQVTAPGHGCVMWSAEHGSSRPVDTNGW